MKQVHVWTGSDLAANTNEQELLDIKGFYCSQGVEVG